MRQSAKAALEHVVEVEASSGSSYSYVYTAHPDKHMHALGVEHPKVTEVVRGLDEKLSELWEALQARGLDATLVVTADHGHVTVFPESMVQLSPEQIDCLA